MRVLPQPMLTSQWPFAQIIPRLDEGLYQKDTVPDTLVGVRGSQYSQYCYYSSLGPGPLFPIYQRELEFGVLIATKK